MSPGERPAVGRGRRVREPVAPDGGRDRPEVSQPVEPDVEQGLYRLAERAAALALERHGRAGCEFGLVLAGDAELHDLNLRFRGVDAPTDVLSFPCDDLPPPGEPPYAGDVAVSLERARAQAQAFGHGLEREVCYLTVHGVLHLLGYDDAGEEDLAEMHRLTEEVMAEMGLCR